MNLLGSATNKAFKPVLTIVAVLTFSLTILLVYGFDCASKNDGTYRNFQDPNKFIQCYRGIRYDQSCPPGLAFDPSINICNWPSEVVYPPDDDHDDNDNDNDDNMTGGKENPNQTDSSKIYKPQGTQCARIVCYYTNWAQYRPTEDSKYVPSDIDPYLCTHIIYAFAKFDGNRITNFERNDVDVDWSKSNFEKVTNLKSTNPKLKVLLAIGGWNMGSEPFTNMVRTASSRSTFISSVISFLRRYKFDGFDLDWEYPANRGSPPEDKMLFTSLVQELRTAFNRESTDPNRRLLLTAAVAAGKKTIDTAYEIPKISPLLDFINLMTYDLHGGWDGVTGHNSPFYTDSQNGDNLNVKWAAFYWTTQGTPKNKLVVGLPTYGRSFTLNGSDDSLGAAATYGTPGTYTREKGYLSYYEICQLISDGAYTHFIYDQGVPYLVHGNQWAGYDDENSLRSKVRFIRDNGFGGAMVWTLDLDDFKGRFCGKGKYPLLKAIHDECLA